jgi:hypothetical protein
MDQITIQIKDRKKARALTSLALSSIRKNGMQIFLPWQVSGQNVIFRLIPCAKAPGRNDHDSL